MSEAAAAAVNPHADQRNFDPLNEEVLAAALEEENADLLKRAAELLKTGADWDKVETIDNDEDAQDLAEFIKQVNMLSGDKGTANVRRETRKKPYDACGKVVQTFFKTKLIDDCEALRKRLLAKATAYVAAKRAAAEAEARRLKAEAEAKAAAAQTPAEIKAASAMMKEADKVAGSGKVKSDFGAGLHSTSRWDFEVTDITKVPAKFLTVDSTAVMAFIRTGTVEKPVSIEGILVKRVTSAVGT